MEMKVSHQVAQKLNVQLMQHLEILQFSSSELEQYIYEKGNENPLLIVEDAEVKSDYEEIMKLAFLPSSINNHPSFHSEDQKYHGMEKKLAQKESFERYLLDQIPIHQGLNEIDLKILRFLIGSLDDRFFLDVDLRIVAEQFKTTYSHVEALLDLLQTFEPIGVGARNLKEYLLIQIDSDQMAPKMASRFILEDLELVSTHAIKQLSKKYKCSMEEVKRTIQYIKKLKPVITGDSILESIHYIIPDVEVREVEGEWVIHLNRHYLPSVSINESYVQIMKDDPDYQGYYKQFLKDAVALLQGIEQRDKTLYEIIRILTNIQDRFFREGMKAIQPLRLKDIAVKLGVHESTISRALRGKYIQTHHGIYALSSLFTKGLVNISGKMDSVMYIKSKIKLLIENENKKSPLTDQQITQLLCEEGIQISRRTVAKYREELNIASSFNRLQD